MVDLGYSSRLGSHGPLSNSLARGKLGSVSVNVVLPWVSQTLSLAGVQTIGMFSDAGSLQTFPLSFSAYPLCAGSKDTKMNEMETHVTVG